MSTSTPSNCQGITILYTLLLDYTASWINWSSCYRFAFQLHSYQAFIVTLSTHIQDDKKNHYFNCITVRFFSQLFNTLIGYDVSKFSLIKNNTDDFRTPCHLALALICCTARYTGSTIGFSLTALRKLCVGNCCDILTETKEVFFFILLHCIESYAHE